MRRVLLGLAFLYSTAYATVHYKLTPQTASHSILVSMTIDSPNPSESFQIPAWCPGYYQIAEYQDKIFDLRASDSTSASLQIDKPDPRTWKVHANPNHKLTLSYKVVGDDSGLGFFAVHVGDDNAFINGAAAFLYVDGRKREAVDLRVVNPNGWEIATAMDSTSENSFKADGYDEFIDHPLQLGTFQRKKFRIDGIPFEVIFVSPRSTPNCDVDGETERIRTVSIPALKMFKGAAFKRYVYILHLEVGNFSGGLEHRASNVQAVANSPVLHLDDLAAHEYFHAWNVKQIRPAVLGPFDYSRPQRTANLWFAEGVTDYYSKLHTFQSGLQSEKWLIAQLADQMQQLQASRTRKTTNLEQASKGCWEADGFSVGDLSYYTKGLLAGFILDSAIIDATNGQKNLDDLMRLLFLQHALPNAGYEEDDLRVAINDVAGTDFSDLYRKMIRSTDELPYELLSKIGLRAVHTTKGISEPNDGSTPDVTSGMTLQLDPAATRHAKHLYQIWLHRKYSVE